MYVEYIRHSKSIGEKILFKKKIITESEEIIQDLHYFVYIQSVKMKYFQIDQQTSCVEQCHFARHG